MNPIGWIALAYGVVAVTLLVYTVRLRRRVQRAELEVRARETLSVTRPSPVP